MGIEIEIMASTSSLLLAIVTSAIVAGFAARDAGSTEDLDMARDLRPAGDAQYQKRSLANFYTCLHHADSAMDCMHFRPMQLDEDFDDSEDEDDEYTKYELGEGAGVGRGSGGARSRGSMSFGAGRSGGKEEE